MKAQVPASSTKAPSSLCFIFWNLGRNFPREHLTALVRDHSPDILMFTEGREACAKLPSLLGPEFLVGSVLERPFVWATRRSSCRFDERESSPRMSLGDLHVEGSEQLILALVHLPSPQHYKPSEQAAFARDVVQLIGQREEAAGHSRTLVVGDFNMDPFHEGMVLADAFHAMMSREVATRIDRTVLGKKYKMFFNPMWRLLANGSTPASYYYSSEAHLAYFWHMFDQVLVRPALLPNFEDDQPQLLTTTSAGPLLKNGRPNNKSISDHLPLRFHLNLSATP